MQASLAKSDESMALLQAEWKQLAALARSPVERVEWWRACVRGLPEAGEPFPLVVRDGGRCVAIAPLALRRGPVPRLELIGVRQLFEPMEFIYSCRSALAQLCDELVRLNLPLDLQRVPKDSWLLDDLRLACKGRALVRVTGDEAYPALDLDAGWSDPESRFNPGRRSDFRRALRRAEKMGEVQFSLLEPRPADVDALLREAYDVECQGWKGRRGTALANDPRRADFYRRYFRECAEQGLLRLAFLRIDGRAVAMQIIVETKRRWWLMKIGYRESFAQLSPGTLLMLDLVRRAVASGIVSIEFLGVAEPWTALWTERVRECVRIRVYPFGIAGAAAFAVDAAGWCGHRLAALRASARPAPAERGGRLARVVDDA